MKSESRAFFKSLKFQPKLGSTQFQGGRRLSRAKGDSLEFSDMREYMPGDDLRRIDWNAYARLETLNIKLYHDEQNLIVHLLVDTSLSMENKSEALLNLIEAAALVSQFG